MAAKSRALTGASVSAPGTAGRGSRDVRGALMTRLAGTAQGSVRSEATIQSDVRMLLLDPELGLGEDDLEVHLETQVGHHRRIDVEVGATVIEVKKSLHSPTVVAAATEQLSDYVITRAAETGQRYVGILTDGKAWIAFHEVDGDLREATRHVASTGARGAVPLLRWLEGVLATQQAVLPTPTEIASRLGADSSSHALDYATLAALYAEHRDLPTVALKRELWASLLVSALGTQFTNSDELFLEHTLLVNSAEIIAHLVLGLDVQELSPATLLSGDQFTAAGLHGVVDRDFFDWVIEVPGGDGFITSLARRLSRFDWSAVEHDVLKVLYESVISAATRKALGEYYTPDWLANKIVAEVVQDPLNQRVLDPSCGSGTFVFFAVRRFLAAAADAGLSLSQAMDLVSSRVMGIDLHPVAVALARVTYLLALGRERLNAPDRGSLSVPIYLGDSLGWDQREDLLSLNQLVIPTEVGDQLLSHELRFDEHLLADSARFDAIIQALVEESGRAAGRGATKLSDGTIRRLAIDEAYVPALNGNFLRLKQLHEAQRNHIWSYYIRNVARPAWLSRPENRVDVLVGNPPWLSYRNMTASMQQRFKLLATDRGFWHSETTATHQDLAGLFVARAVERYLRDGGQLAFIVPNSVIDRDYWSGFRAGRFDGANVQFATSWDLRRIRPHLFPRGSAVIYGTRNSRSSTMPADALIWTGRAPRHHASSDAPGLLHHSLGQLSISSDTVERSPYSNRFSQGASLVPRVLQRVEPLAAGSLGVPSGRLNVRSKRSATEKEPWKDLPDLTGVVESEFVWPTLLGEHVLPFRTLEPDLFVIPVTTRGTVLNGSSPAIDGYPGLAAWVRQAEMQWYVHGGSSLSLAEQIDYMGKLHQQVPPAAQRVVYAKAGMHVAAALVTDPRILIDHKLYWGAVSSATEGRYLVGILNSPSLTELVQPLMSYGKDERDIDKHVWKLPIPAYDSADPIHQRIVELAEQLEVELLQAPMGASYFVTSRRQLRAAITSSAAGQALDRLVRQLVDPDHATSPSASATGGTAPRDSDPTVDDEAPTPSLTRTTTGAMPRLLADVEIDIDCEFDKQGQVYLWGALLTSRDSDHPALRDGIYYSFGDPNGDEGETAHDLLQWLTTQEKAARQAGRSLSWYHYGSTEQRQLIRILGPQPVSITNQALDVLKDVIRPHYYSPTGYGLKHLATTHTAATWHTPGATGRDTYTWLEAARGGDPTSWTTLVTYNEDDVRATRALRERLAADAVDPGVVLAG